MLIWHYTSVDLGQVGGVERHIAALAKEFQILGLPVHIGISPPKVRAGDQVVVLVHGDMKINKASIDAVRSVANVRVLATCHGTSIGRLIGCSEFFSRSAWLGAWKDYSNLKIADGYIAVTPQVKLEVERFFRIQKTHLVSLNGADPQIFSPIEDFQDSSEILFFGRAHDPVKNTDRILQAANEVNTRKAGSISLSLAPGLAPEETPAFAKSFVKSLGKLDVSGTAAAMRTARGLALCSLYEGDALVLHEARSMGLPVIASDLPGLRQSMGEYNSVFWVNPKEVSSIARGMQTLLSTKTTPKPISRPWATVAKEHLKFFQSLFT
jgi:glycosyltransferase involved in cell wall biosynthesis